MATATTSRDGETLRDLEAQNLQLDGTLGTPSVFADGFESGTRSAAAGGNTTIIPFAMQVKGESLRACVTDYHRKAGGKAYIDYGFHLVVSDPTPTVLNQELPALFAGPEPEFDVTGEQRRPGAEGHRGG